MATNPDIGSAAGKIWQHLNKYGSATATKLSEATGLSKNDVQRGIGWLAKEDKLLIEVKGRVETLSLK